MPRGKRHKVSDRLITDVGPEVVRDHFGLTPQNLHMWRVRGVPHLKRIGFQALALTRGVKPPSDFLAPLFGGDEGGAQEHAPVLCAPDSPAPPDS